MEEKGELQYPEYLVNNWGKGCEWGDTFISPIEYIYWMGEAAF